MQLQYNMKAPLYECIKGSSINSRKVIKRQKNKNKAIVKHEYPATPE